MIADDEKSSFGNSEPVLSDKKTKTVEATVASLLNNEIDSSCYVYEDGKCFYIDPSTKTQFEWNESKSEWTVREETPSFSTKDYKFDGETYYYTDEKSSTTYKWDRAKNEWIESPENGGKKTDSKKDSGDHKTGNSDAEEFDDDESRPEFKRQDMSKGVYGFDGSVQTYTDTNDGTVYLWDKEKNAWFPKLDDDFIAQYQMNYGFNEEEETIPSEPKKEETEKSIDKSSSDESLKRKSESSWFDVDEKTNTKVYVSNLPLDTTEQELIDLMQKCGLLMKEETGKFKIKMYTDAQTKAFKGDALCTYIKVESVNLALNILDGYEVKGKKISVERAKFQMKGDYNPDLKPKKKSKKQVEKLKKIQEKLFDWRPDKMRGERGKHERVVIIMNLFEPSQFDKDVGLILEYQQDLREEASKCGIVKKITIYDRHPKGVAQITFKEPEAADACIQLLNRRWFGKRQLSAETWDGKTKYNVLETDEQKAKRLEKWEKFIQKDEKKSIDAQQKMHSDEETQSSAGSDGDTDDESAKPTK